MSENEERIFVCKICDYKCCKKFNYYRHLVSSKHIKATYGNNLATQNEQNEQIRTKYCCEKCGKEYNDRTGLWRHNKKCISNTETISQNNKLSDLDKDELIITLLKQNAELIKGQQDMMMKVVENGITNTNHSHNNNNNTNSHNKAFNLNFFLNETCKNAMNITDFVDSIKLQLNDLMDVGELGYVEGISKIIVKNLNNFDEIVPSIMWRIINKSNTFFDTLPWMPKGRELWERIKEYNPIILTGVPEGNISCAEQKINWCKRELGPDIKVITCLTVDKPNYCLPKSILIDDRSNNLKAWKNKGGKFILYDEEKFYSILERIDRHMETDMPSP